MRLLIDSTSKK